MAFLPVPIQVLWLLPRNGAIAILKVYRKFISPLYGDVCKYYPTCSHYSLNAIRERGLFLGVILTAWRLIRCNPWSEGGIDQVPSAKRIQCVASETDWALPITKRGTAWTSLL